MTKAVKHSGARVPEKSPSDRVDGRSTRWADHRESRRAELVDAAVDAIDRFGTTASIAQIAETAGVSRPVLYRYFADKDDLYHAVGQWGADRVLSALMEVLLDDGSIRDKIYRGADVYLEFLQEHPQVFLLLTEHRSADPLVDGKERIATAFSRVMGDTLRGMDLDTGGSEAWAHGIVGLGLSVGEWWLRRNVMSRPVAADYLASFIWHAFNGFALDNGVQVGDSGHLELISDGPHG